MIFIFFGLIIFSVISSSKSNVYTKKGKKGVSYTINEVGFYEINDIHGEDSIEIKFKKENLRLFAIFTQHSQIILNHLFINGYDSIGNVLNPSEKVSYLIEAKEEAIFEFKYLKKLDEDGNDNNYDINKIEAKFWILPIEMCGESSIFEFGGFGSSLTVGLSEKLITSRNSNEIKYTNCIFSPLFDTSKPYSVSFDINSIGSSGFSKSEIELFSDNLNRPDWTMKIFTDDEDEKNYSTSKPFFVRYEIVQKSSDGQFVSPFNVETRMIRKKIEKKNTLVFNSVTLGCFYGVFDCCDSRSCFHDTEFEETVVVKCDNKNIKKVLKIIAISIGVVLLVIIIASTVGCFFCFGSCDMCCCCCYVDYSYCCCYCCNCCSCEDCCCCCCNDKRKENKQQTVGSSNSIPQIVNMNKNDIEFPLMDIDQQQPEPNNVEIVANPYGL